jgi:hypothetical protein
MAAVDFDKSALGIIFKIIGWIFRKIFGIKSKPKSPDEVNEKQTNVEKQAPTNDYSDIGNVEQNGNTLKVFDTNGKQLYSGNGGKDGRMIYSSKIIVIQNGNSVDVFAIYKKSLKRIYSGNSLGSGENVVNAVEFSFFAKDETRNSKYTISNGSCNRDYNRNY